MRADQRARRDAFRAAAKTRAGFAFGSVDNRNPEIRFFCDVGKLVQKHGLPDAAQSNQRRPTNAHSLERDRSGFNQLATSRHFWWRRTGAGFRT